MFCVFLSAFVLFKLRAREGQRTAKNVDHLANGSSRMVAVVPLPPPPPPLVAKPPQAPARTWAPFPPPSDVRRPPASPPRSGILPPALPICGGLVQCRIAPSAEYVASTQCTPGGGGRARRPPRQCRHYCGREVPGVVRTVDAGKSWLHPPRLGKRHHGSKGQGGAWHINPEAACTGLAWTSHASQTAKGPPPPRLCGPLSGPADVQLGVQLGLGVRQFGRAFPPGALSLLAPPPGTLSRTSPPRSTAVGEGWAAPAGKSTSHAPATEIKRPGGRRRRFRPCCSHPPAAHRGGR